MTVDEYVYMFSLCCEGLKRGLNPIMFYRCKKCQREFNPPAEASKEYLIKHYNNKFNPPNSHKDCDGDLEVILREYDEERDWL